MEASIAELRSSEPCAAHQAHLNHACPHPPPTLKPQLDAAVLPNQHSLGTEVHPRSDVAFFQDEDEPHIGCAPAPRGAAVSSGCFGD